MGKVEKYSRTAADLDKALSYEDQRYSFSSQGLKRKVSAREGDWAGIIDTLYSEHGYILSLLKSLDQQADKLKPGKVPDYHLLLEIVDYLVHYPGQYHHPREDLLFASLLKRQRTFQSRLERLQREHETLQFYNDKLFNELTRIVSGRRADRPELQRAIKKFVAGYRKHIKYESEEIFPLARGSLSAADLKRADDKTRYIDDPLFGREVKRRYTRLGRNLQAAIGNATGNLLASELHNLEPAIENLSGFVERLAGFKNAINALGKDSLQEQLDTVKAHTTRAGGPNVLLLPLALLQNHRRRLGAGFDELRNVVSPDRTAANRVESGDGP